MNSSANFIMAYRLTNASDWWVEVNNSPIWQNRIFHTLAGLYGFVAVVALIQLVRIELRVPEYGWTTQKVFHFLNFVVNAVRSVVFVFRTDVQRIKPEILQHVLLDTPSLAFFTTYALLVLFWAEIYYQARAVSTDGLRPSFFTINGVVYAIQREWDKELPKEKGKTQKLRGTAVNDQPYQHTSCYACFLLAYPSLVILLSCNYYHWMTWCILSMCDLFIFSVVRVAFVCISCISSAVSPW